MADTVIEMRGISKRFGGVRALQDVDFSVRNNEIVCLLGENGAGKSTLMKVLAGVLPDYSGTVTCEGRPVRFRSTREAFDSGISIVFQEFNLCPNLSAMENLFLGNEIQGPLGFISYRRTREEAAAAFARLRTRIDPDALVRELGVAQQQMVEVAKALSHRTRVLVMDEPTSALTGTEVENLFGIMRDLKSRGVSIVFISHKLGEILRIADRVVCLRDGRNSGETETAAATESDLVAMMVGRDLDRMYAARAGAPAGGVVLEAEGVSGPPAVRDVSFRLHAGEILGIAGLIGAGRTELARLLIGAERKTAGRVLLDGAAVDVEHPADAIARGIAYVPEDRKRLGLVLGMTVRENATMSIHPAVSNRAGFILAGRENAVTDEYVGKLRIKIESREQVAGNLSGGNQQKLVLARCLAVRPRVLILDEPTRGIDVAAKAEVHRIITELADRGVGIIVISSELPEILRLSDRVLVMHEGRLTADLSRAEATEEAIMRAAVA